MHIPIRIAPFSCFCKTSYQDCYPLNLCQVYCYPQNENFHQLKIASLLPVYLLYSFLFCVRLLAYSTSHKQFFKKCLYIAMHFLLSRRKQKKVPKQNVLNFNNYKLHLFFCCQYLKNLLFIIL